jgi:hypothetical protein
MRPSDQPEPSPRLGRIPPAPPAAPPTTGEADGPDVPNGPPRARIGGLGKIVALGLMALLVGVWFAGIASVAPAFLAGAAVALFARRSIFVVRPIFLSLLVSFGAALVSNILLGGPLLAALLRGLGVWLAIVPAIVTAVVYHWAVGLHWRRASA